MNTLKKEEKEKKMWTIKKNSVQKKKVKKNPQCGLNLATCSSVLAFLYSGLCIFYDSLKDGDIER